MVATWQPAAPANYYKTQTEYYLGGVEPCGSWYAPGGDFGLVDGAEVDVEKFERLYCGVDDNGNSLITSGRGRSADRKPAFDNTFSASKSVSLVWAISPNETKKAIEQALERSVRAALGVLEREATFARRGRNGERLEPVALTAALFRHGESRPTKHADGRVFGDPNCHVHAVCYNLATRVDRTVGAIHSTAQRDFKLCLGAVMHATLAHELQALGFEIDRVGSNGTFEIKGVDAAHIEYFSARRNEIESALEKHGVESKDAVALAAAVARSTRGSKDKLASASRDEIWKDAARSLGIDVDSYVENLRSRGRTLDREASETLLAERLADLPRSLTENQAVVERKDLLRAVSSALVGTGLPAERADVEIDRMLASGEIIEVGRDRLDHGRYSTPEMVRIERESVAFATRLTLDSGFGIPPERVREICGRDGLNEDQTHAALAATGPGGLAIIAGAAGSGKTTTLLSIVTGYELCGRRVIGAASAWRVARALNEDFAIPSRAIASWLEKLKHGGEFLRRGDVLIVDEAGLLGARDSHALLSHATEVGAKVLLVGEDKQLAPINAGSGLDLCARATEAARVERIVRQREPWAREAIGAFRDGRAGEALDAFAERGKVVETQSAKSAVEAVVATWREARVKDGAKEPLLLCRTNADVAAISRAVRAVLREEGKIFGHEVELPAVTPSGQTTKVSVARGDRIRFLARNDCLGVINGTTATVVAIHDRRGAVDPNAIAIEAEIGERRVVFTPEDVADSRGRARIGWAYASTIYQSQGMTTDRVIALVDAGYDRRQIYVASSRAREDALFVVDAAAIDQRIAADLPPDRQNRGPSFTGDERRAWLARRLSQAKSKESTLDAMDAALAAKNKQARREQAAQADAAGEHRGPIRRRTRELSLD